MKWWSKIWLIYFWKMLDSQRLHNHICPNPKNKYKFGIGSQPISTIFDVAVWNRSDLKLVGKVEAKRTPDQFKYDQLIAQLLAVVKSLWLAPNFLWNIFNISKTELLRNPLPRFTFGASLKNDTRQQVLLARNARMRERVSPQTVLFFISVLEKVFQYLKNE